MASIRATYQFERELWKKGFQFIAGVDEVGMGCLAGPLIAAAVILPVEIRIDFLRDSKTLSHKQRKPLSIEIKEKAIAWGIGSASPEEIETLNLHQADLVAMKRALTNLQTRPDAVLSDGFKIPNLDCYHRWIIKGDQKSRSIAAASIVAKVFRDELMEKYDQEFPGYGFAKHKGYGTKEHLNALRELGVCPIHRQSFEPVRVTSIKQGSLLKFE